MKTTMSMMMMMMTKKKYEAQHSAGLVVTHPSQIAPNELRPTDAKAENNKNRVRLENTDQHNAHYVKKKKSFVQIHQVHCFTYKLHRVSN